jgi:hypothetical protein
MRTPAIHRTSGSGFAVLVLAALSARKAENLRSPDYQPDWRQ